MKRLISIPALVLCVAAFQSPRRSFCSASDYVPCRPGSGGSLKADVERPLRITVDVTYRQQQIHGFGASDAWSIQFVGQWPDEKRQAIADLLFDTDLDNAGNPKGIGLSAWRFNIGAGSSRDNAIGDRWRRADTFLSSDFDVYDWTRLPGQRWFLHAGRSHGASLFTAFVNSPPINMTKNGRAFCDDHSGTTNLRLDKIDEFARYLATIVQHFHDVEGITFDYVSPFNEPNWDWNGSGQEGCRYSNSDIRAVVIALDRELQARALSTQIEIPEAGDIGYLRGNSSSRGNYIEAFFDRSSPYFVGGKAAPTIAGHSYFSCWPDGNKLVGERGALRYKLDGYPGLGYAMTEYCILIPSDSWVPSQYRGYGNGRDLGIGPALWVARVIHCDLTVAEASSWHWWLAVSPYNYKDGLVYIDKGQYDGRYDESKLLWAMGNFSRFIRPGMVRVAVRRSDNMLARDAVHDLMVSAYHEADEGVAAVVFVNWAREARPVRLDLIGIETATLIPYVTRGNDLGVDSLTAYAALSASETMAIPASSIVTVVALPPARDADLNQDYRADFKDLRILADSWLCGSIGSDIAADLTGEGQVDLRDFSALAEAWRRRWNQPPTVWITTPEDGSTVQIRPRSRFIIEADARDPDGWVDKVTFYVDDRVLGEDADGSDGWSIAWPGYAAGSHTFTARAVDNNGSSAGGPVTRSELIAAGHP